MRALPLALTTAILALPVATSQSQSGEPALPPVPNTYPTPQIPRAIPVIPDTENNLDPEGFETPPVLPATKFLPAENLVGPHYRIRNAVKTDGYLAHFIVDSDFGTYDCLGAPKLAQRLKEINALAELAALSKSEVFADALVRSAKQPIDAAKNLVADPVESVKRLPSTAGHFFKRVGSAVGGGIKAVGKEIGEIGKDSREPSKVGEQTESAGKELIGFNSAIANLAKKYGVDPYTDNALLKDQLEEIAWVAFAGGAPIKFGVGAVSGGASIAMKATVIAGLPDSVYQLTPAEIRLQNRESMAVFGADKATQEAFESNLALTPSLSLALIQSLEALGDTKGRDAVVSVAAQLADRAKIEFLIWSLRILARPEVGETLTAITPVGPLPAATTASGKLLVPAAVDYVSWTPQTSAFAKNPDLEGKNPTLLLLGKDKLSDATRKGLTAANWEVREL